MQHNSKSCLLKCLSRKSYQISNICNFTSWYTAIPQWSLDHNSSLKLVDLAGHTNVFQIIKKRRSKGLINNPFMTRKFCTFVTTEILYIFSIKAILLRFWDVTQAFLPNPYLHPVCHLPASLKIMKKNLHCSYSTNSWAAVSLKPCCRYQRVINIYKRLS